MLFLKIPDNGFWWMRFLSRSGHLLYEIKRTIASPTALFSSVSQKLVPQVHTCTLGIIKDNLKKVVNPSPEAATTG